MPLDSYARYAWPHTSQLQSYLAGATRDYASLPDSLSNGLNTVEAVSVAKIVAYPVSQAS